MNLTYEYTKLRIQNVSYISLDTGNLDTESHFYGFQTPPSVVLTIPDLQTQRRGYVYNFRIGVGVGGGRGNYHKPIH